MYLRLFISSYLLRLICVFTMASLSIVQRQLLFSFTLCHRSVLPAKKVFARFSSIAIAENI
jgi:hypothetical protein